MSLAIILITVVSIICINKGKTQEEPIIVKNELKEKITKKQKSDTSVYKVDIKGEVITPGIYTLSSEARVIDVIKEAGGLTDNANTTVINLSKKISDEMVIIIYSNDEVKKFKETKQTESIVISKCEQKNEESLHNDACITNEKEKTNGLISINNATIEELMTLPNIGESKAKNIIEYRSKNGPFTSIDDIKNITGIGESIFAKIKDYITL